MVPNVAGTGTSFKGAALYYLHDKRQDGEDVRLTQDRVAWTQTRNLATDDPELAWKIMAATALDQDRLKAEAGVKNTGRKSSNAVYAYSIAWHPEEVGRIGQVEMLRAAEESIQALGAGDRQILIVAHNDTAHPHVHVVINRVSPEDGRMLGTSNDYKKLDSWALAYRKARGEEQKYCPARAEKRDAMQSREAGADVPFVRGEPSTPRGMVDEVKAAKDAAADALLRERKQQHSLNGALGAKTRAMHEQHRAQWTTLSKDYADRKTQVYENAKTAIDRSRTSITEQYRPTWRDLYRKQWREHKAFEAREQSTSGKIANTLQALSNRALVDPDKKRGLLSSALNFAVSKEARADALAKAHAQEKARLKTEEKKAIDTAVAKIKADRSTLIAKERKSYAAQREALILGQDADRKAMQLAWRDRKTEMARAFDALKRSAAAKPTIGSEIAATELLASLRLRKAFQEAGEGANNSRRPRVRGRDDHER